MQKMSGLDLSFAVAEMGLLQGKRIAKIRRTEEGIFLFRIGSEELLFAPGVRLHITRQVMQATDAPDGFVGFLRKSLEGKTAQSIAKREGERIVEITTRSKERLVFELFRKGNLILVGEDGNIYACLQEEEAGGRKIARGERYEYPKATPFAGKKIEKVAFLVKENEKGGPVSFSCDAESGGHAFPTLSEALDYYYSNVSEESEASKAAASRIAKLEERLSLQQEALLRDEEERARLKGAGDAVYRRYELCERLLEIVKRMKKAGASDEDINREIAPSGARFSGIKIEIDA
jgi:predicted ribosome quality control (RQC) complex YloA/Tae2 family protein